MNKHGFKATLNVIEHQTLFDSGREQISPKEHRAIVTALRIADRLQRGEISEEMLIRAHIGSFTKEAREINEKAFTNMAKQLLDEESE